MVSSRKKKSSKDVSAMQMDDIPELLEIMMNSEEGEKRAAAIMRIYELSDVDHKQNRVPMLCSGEYDVLTPLAQCLTQESWNGRYLACLALNNLSIPPENKSVMALGPSSSAVIGGLCKVIAEGEQDSRLCCVCLMNLSFLEASINSMLQYSPGDGDVAPLDNPESLIRILEKLLKNSPWRTSDKSEGVHWACGLIKNLAKSEENSALIGQTDISKCVVDNLRYTSAPRGRWTHNSIEDFSLFVVLYLAQWPTSREALVATAAMDVVEPIMSEDHLQGLKATMACAFLVAPWSDIPDGGSTAAKYISELMTKIIEKKEDGQYTYEVSKHYTATKAYRDLSAALDVDEDIQVAFGRDAPDRHPRSEFNFMSSLRDVQRLRDSDPKLTTLSLRSFACSRFQPHAWGVLGRFISGNTALEALKLEDSLTDERAEKIFDKCKASSVKTAEFGNIGHRGISSMLPFLSGSERLTSLSITSQDFDTACLDMIADTLKGGPLTHLNLSDCQIKNATALERCVLPDLEFLSLRENGLATLPTLTSYAKLKELWLYDNQLEGVEFQKISDLIQTSQSLTELGLGKNKLHDTDLELLAGAIKSSNTLTYLDVENEELTERGHLAILKCLLDMSSLEATVKSNHSLKFVDTGWDGNTGDHRATPHQREINEVLKINRDSGPHLSRRRIYHCIREKVVKYHLKSGYERSEMCRVQNVDTPYTNAFAAFDPCLLPDVFGLLKWDYGGHLCGSYRRGGLGLSHNDLYLALRGTAPAIMNLVNRVELLSGIFAKNNEEINEVLHQASDFAVNAGQAKTGVEEAVARLQKANMQVAKDLGEHCSDDDEFLKSAITHNQSHISEIDQSIALLEAYKQKLVDTNTLYNKLEAKESKLSGRKRDRSED